MANVKRVPLRGSEHAALPGAHAIGPIDPHQLIEISVLLKHRHPLPKLSGQEKCMSHSEFAQAYGAEAAHVDQVRDFARANHLQMLEHGDEILRRTVTLAGTVAAMEKAFGVELTEYEHPEGSYRGHAGPIQIPEELSGIVTGVLGLDNRPMVQPHIRFRSTTPGTFGARLSTQSYNPQQVGSLYNFPPDATGAGQTIGLLEFGGGYRPADVRNYFQSIGVAPPTMKTVSVDQAHNRPSTAQSADGEVMLDIDVAGAVAPGCTIAVYFAPNSARGFYDALSTAVHDQLRKPSVISISWGGPESSWSAQSMENFDQVAQEAGLLGITITVASGDNGSSDGIGDGRAHVDFPASCPHVLALGGTRLTASNGAIQDEVVWNGGAQSGASGGGYSTQFARPTWQSNMVSTANRGVPDMAANADPDTGYNILVDGQQMVVGGTSAVAPLYAGLIVLLNQKLNRRLGFVNPALYADAPLKCFHDITAGNNGAYTAGFGWDACTGLGSPIGTQMLQALGTAAQEKSSTIAGAHARS